MRRYNKIDELFEDIPLESKIFIRKLTGITDLIESAMKERRWSQKDLAKHLKKNESEVSTWLTTPHNLTLKTISKIEAVLGEELISIPGNIEASNNKEYVYLVVKAKQQHSETESQEESVPMHETAVAPDFSPESDFQNASFNRALAS